MNSSKEDLSILRDQNNESYQNKYEEDLQQICELFEAKNYESMDDSKLDQHNCNNNAIKRVFNKQINSYILSINEAEKNSQLQKVQFQINNLSAQTLIFSVYIHNLTLNITAVTSKNDVLNLKILPNINQDSNKIQNVQQSYLPIHTDNQHLENHKMQNSTELSKNDVENKKQTENQNTTNNSFTYIISSDFLIKKKWVNLIIDFRSFFDRHEDVVIQNIEIGSQCMLKSIYYSKQQDLQSTVLRKKQLFGFGNQNKFLTQQINLKEVILFGQDKNISSQTICSTNFPIQTSQKIPNQSNRFKNRHSIHLSNYKYNQVAQNQKNDSSKSYSKQILPSICQQYTPSRISANGSSTTESGSHAQTSFKFTNSNYLSKAFISKESKNSKDGIYNSNNRKKSKSIQQSQQYNSYLKNNCSFEQHTDITINSNFLNKNNVQNVKQMIQINQSQHPNCPHLLDEEQSQTLNSGINTSRTSSMYFYNGRKRSQSYINSRQLLQQSCHSSSIQKYQIQNLKNNISEVNNNFNHMNDSIDEKQTYSNCINLPKIMNLLKQKSSSIISVQNKINQNIELKQDNLSRNITSAQRIEYNCRNNDINIASPSENIATQISFDKNQDNSKIFSKVFPQLPQDIINQKEQYFENNKDPDCISQIIDKQSHSKCMSTPMDLQSQIYNSSQNTVLSIKFLPNNSNINGLNNRDYELKSEKLFQKIQDEDENNFDKFIKHGKSQSSFMSEISSIQVNNVEKSRGQNKENEPECRNTTSIKNQKQFIQSGKRRSSLLQAISAKNASLQKNIQTINIINTIYENQIKQPLKKNQNMNQSTQQHLLKSNHKQSNSLINNENQNNQTFSSHQYQEPQRNKKVSQTLVITKDQRKGNLSLIKGNLGEDIQNNSECTSQLLFSDLPQSSLIQLQCTLPESCQNNNKQIQKSNDQEKNCKLKIENKSNKVNNQINEFQNNSEMNKMKQKSQQIGRKRIISLQQYHLSKQISNTNFQINHNNSKQQQNIVLSKINQQPVLVQEQSSNSQNIVQKSNIQNENNNSYYQPKQLVPQNHCLKKYIHQQKQTGTMPSKQFARHISPFQLKSNLNNRNINQNININNGNIVDSVRTDSIKSERNTIYRRLPLRSIQNTQSQQTSSPVSRNNQSNSNLNNQTNTQNKQNSSLERFQQIQKSVQIKNKQLIGLNFTKLISHLSQDNIQNKNKENEQISVISNKILDIQDNREIIHQIISPQSEQKNVIQIENNLNSKENLIIPHLKNEQINPKEEQSEIKQNIIEEDEQYFKKIQRFSSFNNPLNNHQIPQNILENNKKSNEKLIQNICKNVKEKSNLSIQQFQNPLTITASYLIQEDESFQNNNLIEQQIKQTSILQNNNDKFKVSKIKIDEILNEKYKQEILDKDQHKIHNMQILRKSNNQNEEEIEEQINVKDISVNHQSISILDKDESRALNSSGSVYQSEHMTSDEEECNESGLVISIVVDNIDQQDIDLNIISDKNNKTQSPKQKAENKYIFPKIIPERKYDCERNSFLQDIKLQTSSNSIEISRVLLIQDIDKNITYDKQEAYQ